MKHTIIALAMALCTLAATAKTGNTPPDLTYSRWNKMHKPFLHTKFELEENELKFSKLPLRATTMYILDEQGNQAATDTLSRKNNKVNVTQLRPGLYTIVLKQGNKTRMYGYHTDVVVKGAHVTHQ